MFIDPKKLFRKDFYFAQYDVTDNTDPDDIPPKDGDPLIGPRQDGVFLVVTRETIIYPNDITENFTERYGRLYFTTKAYVANITETKNNVEETNKAADNEPKKIKASKRWEKLKVECTVLSLVNNTWRQIDYRKFE